VVNALLTSESVWKMREWACSAGHQLALAQIDDALIADGKGEILLDCYHRFQALEGERAAKTV
jgi:hypothetical protein